MSLQLYAVIAALFFLLYAIMITSEEGIKTGPGFVLSFLAGAFWPMSFLIWVYALVAVLQGHRAKPRK